MNIQARVNYQKGITQNTRSESTTYNIENEIDRYIVAKVELRKAAAENRAIIKEPDLEEALGAAAEAAIKNIFNI